MKMDTGNLVDDVLYKALDELYLRGWQDRNKGKDYDPRGTTQWQDVLDLFRLQNQQTEISKDNFKLTEFPDGTVCLECGEGMERDLVFASGAMKNDPDLEQQRKLLEFIMKAIKHYDCITTGDIS